MRLAPLAKAEVGERMLGLLFAKKNHFDPSWHDKQQRGKAGGEEEEKEEEQERGEGEGDGMDGYLFARRGMGPFEGERCGRDKKGKASEAREDASGEVEEKEDALALRFELLEAMLRWLLLATDGMLDEEDEGRRKCVSESGHGNSSIQAKEEEGKDRGKQPPQDGSVQKPRTQQPNGEKESGRGGESPSACVPSLREYGRLRQLRRGVREGLVRVRAVKLVGLPLE